MVATNTWAKDIAQPMGGHCFDTWTMAQVPVAIAGRTPSPGAISSQASFAPDVVVTPIALLTLHDTGSRSVAAKYNAAYKQLNVSVDEVAGQYDNGMINSGGW